MARWTYGNYEFEVNPYEAGIQTQLVGDDVRTLSGAYVSQPSFLYDKFSASVMFYQGRTRVKSKVALQNAFAIDVDSNYIYILNKVNDRIDIYNKNFILQNSVSLAAVTQKNYIGMTVKNGRYYIASKSGIPANQVRVREVDSSGTVLSTSPTSFTDINPVGFTYFNNYYWVISSGGTIKKIRPVDGVVIVTIVLPFGLYYQGLSNDGQYLIIGNMDSYPKFYHVDTETGQIINQIASDVETLDQSTDIAFDGKLLYGINSSSGVCQVVTGNTVDVELLNFQKEITSKKFVDLVDDMGVIKRSFIGDLKISRSDKYENAYNVTMTITKVNRG